MNNPVPVRTPITSDRLLLKLGPAQPRAHDFQLRPRQRAGAMYSLIKLAELRQHIWSYVSDRTASIHKENRRNQLFTESGPPRVLNNTVQ